MSASILADTIDEFTRVHGYRPNRIDQQVLAEAADALEHLRLEIPGIVGRIGLTDRFSGRIMLDLLEWRQVADYLSAHGPAARPDVDPPALGITFQFRTVTVMLDESTIVIREQHRRGELSP